MSILFVYARTILYRLQVKTLKCLGHFFLLMLNESICLETKLLTY